VGSANIGWRRALRKRAPATALFLAGVLAAWGLAEEFEGSRLQSRLLGNIASQLSYTVEPGPSPSIRFPHSGPYDQRLGYDLIPGFVERLVGAGYGIREQARLSPMLARLTDLGLFSVYREKSRTGLTLLDGRGEPLYANRYPERAYDRFEAIPPDVVDALLFIEDRELLDAEHPARNPAVDWPRFGKAAVEQLRRVVEPGHAAPGGSTLATQIEKYRHSPGGRTASAQEKLRQMASASLRAYLDGENTLTARRQIVVDYLNSMPLLAQPGRGEIAGLGDGLEAWYGRDFAEFNRLLGEGAAAPGAAPPAERGLAFKQALSLLIAQRRPARYLGGDAAELERQTDSHLRLLAAAGLIDAGLRDAALAARLELRRGAAPAAPVSFVQRKAGTALRNELSELLGVDGLYDLDRLDLRVGATLDGASQAAVAGVLQRLNDPAYAGRLGLYGYHMLRPGDDPGRLAFSVSLFERSGDANLLRVQTDSLDRPFDINDGARLDLGSTAKLRTLVTYLEVVAELHARYAGRPAEDLAKERAAVRADPLASWAIAYLAAAESPDLATMLAAALERRYPASPAESFFTGGGLHRFRNFEAKDNGRAFTVGEAFRNSINLVFVRLMRDLVRHYAAVAVGDPQALLADPDDPRRAAYLARFADREGVEFLERYYRKYRGKTPAEAEALLLDGLHPLPGRVAAALRSIDPGADAAAFAAAMRRQLPDQTPSDAALARYYRDYEPARLSLADRAYVAGVHPLELWLVGWLQQHPDAGFAALRAASAAARQDAYAWLFKAREKRAQDVRIGETIEYEAFAPIARDWQKLGYPFAAITPSLAAAIGAAGDRPGALAELVGILLNDGVRLPATRIDSIRFGAGTPFDTRLARTAAAPQRVLPAEVAQAARRAMVDVVRQGTARRLDGVFGHGSEAPDVGGKTGTGDHRYVVMGPGGQAISSRPVSRAATFVFFIGGRFFGTVTAYAESADAARYTFTSALAVQLLKSLLPALQPALGDEGPTRLAAAPPALSVAERHSQP